MHLASLLLGKHSGLISRPASQRHGIESTSSENNLGNVSNMQSIVARASSKTCANEASYL